MPLDQFADVDLGAVAVEDQLGSRRLSLADHIHELADFFSGKCSLLLDEEVHYARLFGDEAADGDARD